jgi:hypothetical protein
MDTKSVDEKLKEVQKAIVVHNYLKDKNGWVTFSANKPKQKLRKYITALAQKLGTFNQKAFRVNRDTLIEYYNKDGLQGVNRVMFISLTDVAKTKSDE